MSFIKINVQTADFSIADEINWLQQGNLTDGALVTFIGQVRQQNLDQNVQALHLEHYPQMTEKALADIVAQAKTRWSINRVTIIHRVGTLAVGDNIVFVGVTSQHRGDAYQANEFIMDYLKTRAPFWKKEKTASGEKWLDAKASDQQQAERW